MKCALAAVGFINEDINNNKLFNNFNKKEKPLPERELKWNKMWELWSEGKADSPYAELMTYQSEINNGGHSQYFENIENVGNLQKEMSELENILPRILKNNLLEAYKSFLALRGNPDNEKAEELMETSDEVYYENEELIDLLLEEYSEKIIL